VSTHDPEATEGPRTERHHRLIAQAEVHHLVRVLEPHRVMHRDAFREAAGAATWHDGSFDSTLAAAVEAGAIEKLAGDFYRIPGFTQGGQAA